MSEHGGRHRHVGKTAPLPPPPQTVGGSVSTGKHRRRRPGKVLNGLTAVRDIGFVSFGKYGQYLVTIVTLPLIARILGTEGLGLLAIAMSAYFIGSLLVDLGITTFLAAMLDDANVNQLRGNYLVIRSTLLATMGLLLLGSFVLEAPLHLHMILLGLFCGGFASFGDDWVLVGHGRFGIIVIYQSVSRILYLALLVFLLPKFPNASIAMLCLLISSIVPVALTWRRTIKDFGTPSRPHEVVSMIRMGAPVVTSRLLVTSYGQGAATIYSGALTAAALGLFSASDRLVRAFQSLLDAIGYGLLPRLARGRDDTRFWRRSIEALSACVGVAVVACLVLWIFAPQLISLIFGADFATAVDIMRVQVFILPFTAVSSFITTAILPVRQDTTGVLTGAIIGTVLAVGSLGVALATQSVWALVYGTLVCEIAVAFWYLLRLRTLHGRERTRSREAVYNADTVIISTDDVPTFPIVLATREYRP